MSRLRGEALSGSETNRLLRDQVLAHELAAGLVAVTGPGVVVELTDGPPTDHAGGVDLARVLDRDLQVVVNGLFASGAEAVSVNGERITALSAIRGAGGAVLVELSTPVTPVRRSTQSAIPIRSNGSSWRATLPTRCAPWPAPTESASRPLPKSK